MCHGILSILRSYAGFLFGLPTVLLTHVIRGTISGWIDSFVRAIPYIDGSYAWISAVFHTLVASMIGSFFFLGPFVFLGGLIGNHPIRVGILITVGATIAMLTVWLFVDSAGSYSFGWINIVFLSLFYLSSAFSTVMAYLLGYSLRRLIYLSSAAARRKA